MEESASHGEALRKIATGHDWVKVLQEREMMHFGKTRDGQRHDGELAKGPEEREQELKPSRYGYNQRKN